MKIRGDFVTNSSSSSFTCEITVRGSGGTASVGENPMNYDPEQGGTVYFDADLHDISDHLASVESLARWLALSLKADCETPLFKGRKTLFVKSMQKKFASIEEIEKVEISRRYDAWGEFADLVADGDLKLKELAKKYLESTGTAKEQARAEMLAYINTTTDARGDIFGWGCAVSRYVWYGNSLDQLAERLCSNRGPGSVSGRERKSVDLKTGEYIDESEFYLS